MLRMLTSAFLLAVAILVVAFVVRPTGTPASAPAPQAPPGAQSAPPAAEPAPPPRAPGEVAVEIDEATLTRQVNAAAAGLTFDDTPLGSASVRDLRVQLRGGQVVATGTAQIGPTPLPVSLTGTVQAQNGRPDVVVSDARIGIVQLPQSTRQTIEQTLQAQLDGALRNQPVRVRSVTIGDGKITIIGAPA
jgi:hypothetical protein